LRRIVFSLSSFDGACQRSSFLIRSFHTAWDPTQTLATPGSQAALLQPVRAGLMIAVLECSGFHDRKRTRRLDCAGTIPSYFPLPAIFSQVTFPSLPSKLTRLRASGSARRPLNLEDERVRTNPAPDPWPGDCGSSPCGVCCPALQVQTHGGHMPPPPPPPPPPPAPPYGDISVISLATGGAPGA
jgi:hypothetical protein